MRELLLEGRVSWRSERSGQDRTLSIGPARIFGLRRLIAALGFAAVAAMMVALVALAAGAVAAGLGARWVERRREQGLDDPIAMVQQRVHEAREWIDARRSSQNNAPGSDF
ncbi:MAG: hypothetical protein F4Z00_01965 [Acidimicrobiaceae bacterium]|nr:hypothetical protein [Acidimicrobiaceae bacterium]MCY3644605.1 hypothetical protein [Acidimicrobiaceae bacterium]MDE0495295.1 hypothetical protein [Acidimicrobiaceae bacterium]MDE0666376.1 hypothetical protein [Acidimicrobiaceae bacterium]MXY10109.1 hypothetical protein [Acidimicrobiaceae bacterium]